LCNFNIVISTYTLSEAWSGVNWADLMAAQGAFGTDFYDRSILRPKHRAYYRSGGPVIKIGPKGALGSHEIRPIHSSKPRTEYSRYLIVPSLLYTVLHVLLMGISIFIIPCFFQILGKVLPFGVTTISTKVAIMQYANYVRN